MNGDMDTLSELRAARRPTHPPTTSAAGADGGTISPASLLRIFGLGKDSLDWLLDLFLIGEIPVLGQLPGALATAGMIILAARRSRSRPRLAFAVILLLVDNAPLVNNLPLATIAGFIL